MHTNFTLQASPSLPSYTSQKYSLVHTHTQPFNGLLSGTTRVGRYQKKHTPSFILDFFVEPGVIMEAEAPAVRVDATPFGLTTPQHPQPPHVFTGRMPFLPPNQQHQSTAGVKRFLLGWSPLAFGESQRPLTRQ